MLQTRALTGVIFYWKAALVTNHVFGFLSTWIFEMNFWHYFWNYVKMAKKMAR